MSHALRMLEKNVDGAWTRMPIRGQTFTKWERHRMDVGDVVRKWGALFRLYQGLRNDRQKNIRAGS